MKKLVKLFLAVVLTVGVSYGVSAQSLKIGHVDSASIMEIMPERAKIEQDLQAYAAEPKRWRRRRREGQGKQ